MQKEKKFKLKEKGGLPEEIEPRSDETAAAEEGAIDTAPGPPPPPPAMGWHMEAAFSPMARLLTGPRPEGAETVAAAAMDSTWGAAPSDTCVEPATE